MKEAFKIQLIKNKMQSHNYISSSINQISQKENNFQLINYLITKTNSIQFCQQFAALQLSEQYHKLKLQRNYMGCINSKTIDDQQNQSEKRVIYHDQETVDLSKLTLPNHTKNGKQVKQQNYMEYQADVVLPFLKDGQTQDIFILKKYQINSQKMEQKQYKVPKMTYPKFQLNLNLLMKDVY